MTRTWVPKPRRHILKLSWRGRHNAALAVYEARVEDLKEQFASTLAAKDITIQALAEQVEYLRSLLGRAQPTRLSPALPEPPPLRRGTPLHVTEEEEDARIAHSAGLIDADELEAELRRLGINVETD